MQGLRSKRVTLGLTHFSLFLRDVFIRQIGLPWRQGNPTCLVNALLGITRLPGTTFYLFPDF